MKAFKLTLLSAAMFCFMMGTLNSCSSKHDEYKQPKPPKEKKVDVYKNSKNIYDGTYQCEIKTVTIQVFYSDSYDETIVLHGGNLFYMIDDNTGANYIIDRTNSRSKDDYDVLFKTTAPIKIVSYQ